MFRRNNAVIEGSVIARYLCGLMFFTQAIHAATTEKWVTLTQLTEPTPTASYRFGEAVSMSDNYLVVGAPGTSSGAGTVYVFTRTAAMPGRCPTPSMLHHGNCRRVRISALL